MKIERVNETFVKINDDTIRIEAGKVRKRAVATAELLDDAVTAEHYFAGKRIINGVEHTGMDALGKPIVIGEEMNYIDHRGDALEWNVYVKDADGVFQRVGDPHPDYDTAIGAAAELV